MPMTLYFAICHFSAPDTVFLTLPRMPPKGIITSILVKFIITGIFGIITARSCYHMWRQLCVAEIQALSQRLTDRPITDGSWTTHNLSGCDNNKVDQFNNVPLGSWHSGIRYFVWIIALLLWSIIVHRWWQDLYSGQIVTTKIFSNSVVHLLFVHTYSRFSSVASRFLREVPQPPHIFLNPRTPSKFGTLAFVYSTSTSQDELDQLSSFDTDSSF
jgi:hypothetical protein